jgi:hypothetical protein
MRYRAVTTSIALAKVSIIISISLIEIANGGETYSTSANGRSQTPFDNVSRHTCQPRRSSAGYGMPWTYRA